MSGGDGPMSTCKGRRRYSSLSGEKYMVVWDTHKVKKAFFALVYNGVRVAILWDSDEQRHVGMLTITDFIRILHQYYRSPTTPMTELENHQIKTWRGTSIRFVTLSTVQPILFCAFFQTEQLTDYQRPLISITPEKTLLEAVQKLLNHKVHRLPVIDPIGGNPLHILTHKRVLKYLYIHLNQLPSPSFMSKKLRDLKLGTTDGVITVNQDCPLHRTLQLFIEHRVSALPVVDSNGHLVDIYAKFDVINLAATRTYQNLDITVYDALNYRRGKFQGVATCQLDDTLESIVNRIAEAGVHRLVIVEDNKVIGVVSLSDLLRFLISEPLVEAMVT
ncbi:hypothetical protein T265_12465 [Opisthorchis viverrini]|uniref:CBS domain-containing protein n=1 Tax=Opisthorchis viverrini TaxID=6198 RepID=A0A075A6H6_OPIVI|nr:hypothetical protein T265_12465 [Opisthorchis viverrini]KER33967.1 hypothetical protein T265_12465 [Opisthorchis viverrini]